MTRSIAGPWLDEGLLGRVRQLLGTTECYLVGGAIRDHLLDRPAHDLDLVARGDGEDIARRLEHGLPGKLIRIGGERFAALRLVAPGGVIDLWDCGDESLEHELERRDLTINAIAIDLATGRSIDPLDGRGDLERRQLRACSDSAFDADPLRVLRLARFAAELPSFTISTETTALARLAAPGLDATASERRRQEFGRSMGAPRADAAIACWAATDLYPGLFGGTADPPTAVARASRHIERSREVFRGSQLARFDVELANLHTAIALTASRGEIDFLLAAGHLSRREARKLAITTEAVLPRVLADQRWLLHRSGEHWPDALAFAAACTEEDSSGSILLTVDRIVELAAAAGDSIFKPTRLLDGTEISRLTGVPGGPALGKIARRLRRRQVEGAISTREEAEAWLLSEHRSSDAG